MKHSKNSIRFGIFLSLILAGLIGCSNSISVNDYYNLFSKFDENSCLTTKVGEYNYYLQYRPADYQALIDLRGSDNIKSEFEEVKSKYSEGQQFLLRINTSQNIDILRNNIRNENQYYKRIEVLSSSFNSRIKGITSDGDTIPCSFHHFERTYKLTPHVQVLFSFIENSQIDRVIIKDDVFNQSQLVTFENVDSYIKKLPNLSL